mmetsp:Transcript_13885/g.32094  ORF Transcript_13885/g.32094 Transcript_13885/m.32094 type:complete len:106 (+) Transcript_13885:155-472(+)
MSSSVHRRATVVALVVLLNIVAGLLTVERAEAWTMPAPGSSNSVSSSNSNSNNKISCYRCSGKAKASNSRRCNNNKGRSNRKSNRKSNHDSDSDSDNANANDNTR